MSEKKGTKKTGHEPFSCPQRTFYWMSGTFLMDPRLSAKGKKKKSLFLTNNVAKTILCCVNYCT